nr:Atp8 [Trebouxia sp. A1-2]
MPQLDKITFLSQFFWLSFFYLGFYFLILKYFLPKMSRVLKFRKRRMNTSQEGVTNVAKESGKVGNSYHTLLSTTLTTCKSAFNKNLKEAGDWLLKNVSEGNKTKLKDTNTNFISSLGERSISQRLYIIQAFADLSERARFALCLNKFRFSRKANFSTLSNIAALHKNEQAPIYKKPYSHSLSEKSETTKPSSENKSKNKTKIQKNTEVVAQKDALTKKAGTSSSSNKENKGRSNKKR